uniref:Uncharacterized protein n=2 Tax=Arundo donax TaxID=35708 RepID=A0A0A9GCI6_ARUDO
MSQTSSSSISGLRSWICDSDTVMCSAMLCHLCWTAECCCSLLVCCVL